MSCHHTWIEKGGISIFHSALLARTCQEKKPRTHKTRVLPQIWDAFFRLCVGVTPLFERSAIIARDWTGKKATPPLSLNSSQVNPPLLPFVNMHAWAYPSPSPPLKISRKEEERVYCNPFQGNICALLLRDASIVQRWLSSYSLTIVQYSGMATVDAAGGVRGEGMMNARFMRQGCHSQ